MARTRTKTQSANNGATIGYEAELWRMADALRGSMDAAEYTHVVLGRVYEYFLSQFASAEGKKGGEFYTPRCVVKLLVEMLEPYRGRVYDPCCGSSGMFVQSVEFIRAHANGNGNGGRARADISIYGQESNYTTWRHGVLRALCLPTVPCLPTSQERGKFARPFLKTTWWIA